MIEDMIIKRDKREEDMREVFAEAPKKKKEPVEDGHGNHLWFWSVWSRG